MPRKKSNKPTDSECLILHVLWERRSATVREVFEALSEKHEMGYTTVLKFMQIMTGKGLLERDTTVRPQVYRAAARCPVSPQGSRLKLCHNAHKKREESGSRRGENKIQEGSQCDAAAGALMTI